MVRGGSCVGGGRGCGAFWWWAVGGGAGSQIVVGRVSRAPVARRQWAVSGCWVLLAVVGVMWHAAGVVGVMFVVSVGAVSGGGVARDVAHASVRCRC